LLTHDMGLSIVVSSYNYGRFLRTAIDSALAQASDHLQVIVVDDGSTDESIDIIKSYGNSIEPLFQSNQGQIKSCAAGLKRCKHDIVIFLDSDDRLEPFAAAEILALWAPGTVKVQYALQAIDSKGSLVNTVFPKFDHPGRAVPRRCLPRDNHKRHGVFTPIPRTGHAHSGRV